MRIKTSWFQISICCSQRVLIWDLRASQIQCKIESFICAFYFEDKLKKKIYLWKQFLYWGLLSPRSGRIYSQERVRLHSPSSPVCSTIGSDTWQCDILPGYLIKWMLPVICLQKAACVLPLDVHFLIQQPLSTSGYWAVKIWFLRITMCSV